MASTCCCPSVRCPASALARRRAVGYGACTVPQCVRPSAGTRCTLRTSSRIHGKPLLPLGPCHFGALQQVGGCALAYAAATGDTTLLRGLLAKPGVMDNANALRLQVMLRRTRPLRCLP